MVEGFSLLAFLEADRRVAHGDVRPTGLDLMDDSLVGPL